MGLEQGIAARLSSGNLAAIVNVDGLYQRENGAEEEVCTLGRFLSV
jgi:hypothetical protein